VDTTPPPKYPAFETVVVEVVGVGVAAGGVPKVPSLNLINPGTNPDSAFALALDAATP
jgi:hypothetical protein